jgi:hypothetical protein
MKTNILKIFAIATLMIFFGAGVSLADDWKGDGGRRGYAYGHYKHGGYPHCQYCAPRPIYVERQYYPVVVERHVYHPPVVYQAPAPSGYFFGMSVMEPGMAFSFGMSGH